MSDHRHLVLVGLMGAGKTTVGRVVAEQLGRPLVDSDAAIEATTGRTVREIWLDDGEPAYRVMESAALRTALADDEPLVIAAAGGVVLAAENRAALAGPRTVVVWLTADTATLVERAARGDHRPLLDDDPGRAMLAMAAARDGLYREVADVTVDTAGRSLDAVAADVIAALAAVTSRG